MFLLAAAFEFVGSILLEGLLEIVCGGTGHLLIWLFSAGRIQAGSRARMRVAAKGVRQVGEGWATLVGLVFWIAVALVVALVVTSR